MAPKTRERPGCLGWLLSVFRRSPSGSREVSADEELPYRLRDDFLSVAELSYFKVLRSVLGPRATICPKVGLRDVLFVAKPNLNMSYVNRIASKHIDFILCESSTMRPVVAIELDDASHSRADRRERDLFVDDAFRQAGLPLIRVPNRAQYSQEEVLAQLRPILAAASGEARTAKPGPERAATPATEPSCPKCGIPMVVRTAVKGSHKGEQFYGCANYPQCREVLPLSQGTVAG